MKDYEAVVADHAELDEGASSVRGGPHWRREHFIPLRKAVLVRALADDANLSAEHRVLFVRLAELLAARIHRGYYRRLAKLKDTYAPLNPDAVTRELTATDEAERERRCGQFFDDVVELLQRANYQRLTRAEIEGAVGIASHWGVRLKVDFDVFVRLEVFSRGDVVSRRTIRNWKRFNREEEVEVPIYQRLVVIFQLCDHKRLDDEVDTRSVYLKLFKNIPKQDVDMLLPGTDFRMSMVDHGKIILPTITGVAMALAKLLKLGLFALFAGFWGILGFLGVVGGAAGYGVKSFMGYLRTKDKYRLSLTRNLYYQNLDNNAGVLFRVFDEAEEQDCREAILAYALLRRGGGGWTAEQLDQEAESYLNGLLGFGVDFEVGDALRKLELYGCAACSEAGQWTAVDLPEAIEILQRPE